MQENTVVPTARTAASFLAMVGPDLQRIRVGLQELCQDLPEPLRPLTRSGALDGGKMLRSALLLLWGRAGGAVTERHIQAGIILELLHNATLLHDDVLDKGRIRRGVPTVNHRWGNQTAVLFGDLLLGKVLELSAGSAPEVRTALGRIAVHTCDGEILQTAHAGHFTLSEQEYLVIIGKKTAALFEGACYIGACLAGISEPQCRAAARFGYHVGTAYQIMDDLLDIAGDGKALRKTLGTDLRGAKPTLPLIHALCILPRSPRARLLRKLRSHSADTGELLAVLADTDSMEYVLRRLRNYTDEALDVLRGFPQTAAATALSDVPEWIVREATQGVAVSGDVRGRSSVQCPQR